MNMEGNIGKEPIRPKYGAAVEKDSEHKEMMLNRLAREYHEVQLEIIQEQKNLNEGNEYMIGVQDPTLREKGIKEGRRITQELEALHTKKEGLEQLIRTNGGNPGDYTLQ
jgi:hypothetical protein